MKKLSLAVAVAATLGAGVAAAYTTAVPADGVLVPNVIQNSNTDTTAVGLINHASTGVTVYWTFFDEDSNHITDGQFTMTGGDFEAFVWDEATSGVGLGGQRGYLTFHVGNSDGSVSAGRDAISAAAFQLTPSENDAEFVPTFPIVDADLVAGSNLTTLDSNSYVTISGAANAVGGTVDMRYEINQYWSSKITLWATGGLNSTHTVNMFDDDQNRKSVNFVCGFDELCFIDPTDIVGRPANFTRGFVRLNTQYIANATSGGRAGSFVSYTTMKSTDFTATQTVLNSHF